MSCGAGSSVYCMSGFGNGVRNRGGGLGGWNFRLARYFEGVYLFFYVLCVWGNKTKRQYVYMCVKYNQLEN